MFVVSLVEGDILLLVLNLSKTDCNFNPMSACLDVNIVTVYSYGFLLNCTTLGQASETMVVLRKNHYLLVGLSLTVPYVANLRFT